MRVLSAGVSRSFTAASRSSVPYATSATSGAAVVITLPMLAASFRMSMNGVLRETIGVAELCCSLLPMLMTTSGSVGYASDSTRPPGMLPTQSGCCCGKFACTWRACVTGSASSSASCTTLSNAFAL